MQVSLHRRVEGVTMDECRDVWFSALYSVNDMLLGNHAKKSKDKIIDVPNFSFPPCPFLSALLGIHLAVLKK